VWRSLGTVGEKTMRARAGKGKRQPAGKERSEGEGEEVLPGEREGGKGCVTGRTQKGGEGLHHYGGIKKRLLPKKEGENKRKRGEKLRRRGKGFTTDWKGKKCLH